MQFHQPMTVCEGAPCQAFRPGHNMHHMHASYIGRTPWGWRDAVVTAVSSRVVHVEYLEDQASLVLWHHRPLGVELGDPVRVHEQYHAIGFPFGWFNVISSGGLGPVPEPLDVALWDDQMHVGIVDMGMGNGLAVDHAEPLDPT